MLKLGIIGCGRQATKLLIALKELPHLYRLTAICDTNPEAMQIFLNGVSDSDLVFTTTDYKELINNSEVDAVLIATPTFTHIEIASYALEMNKDIFLEKPIGLDIKSIDKFILKAAKTDSIVQVEFPFHYAYYFQTVSSILETTLFNGSKFITINEHRGPFLGEWFYDNEKSGGSINDKLIHFFEISNSIFYPARATKVYAAGSQHNYHKGMKLKSITNKSFTVENPTIVDHASITVEYENGAILNITMNMYQKTPIEGAHMSFTGTTGEHITVILEGNDVEIKMQDEENKITTYELQNKNDNDHNGLNHPGVIEEFKDFYSNVKKRLQPSANLWLAREAQIISLAAEESISNQSVIDLTKYRSKSIEKIADKKRWNTKRDFQRYKLVRKDKSKVLTNKHQDLIDRIYKEIRDIFPEDKEISYKIPDENIFQNVISKINLDKKLCEILKNFNEIIEFKILDDKYFIKCNEGKIKLEEYAKAPSMSAEVTKEGLEGLLFNKSIIRLYLTSDIKFKGDFKSLERYREVLIRIVELLRVECITQSS